MPLILSKERTVGIEVPVNKPFDINTVPRLPILGTVPDHWKEGEAISIHEYVTGYTKQFGAKQLCIIPLTTK